MKNNQNVITFGCRLNMYESEIIKSNLEKSAIHNVIVINTCAVTTQAEKNAKQAIRKISKEDPTKKIIVTGCAAQNNPEMFSNMPEVDKIIGNEEKLSDKYYTFDTQRVLVNDIMSIKKTANHMLHDFDGKTRAFIQIQNGCDHRCTFCIIPFGRGNSRSVPIGVIVEQIRILQAKGYQEIVLTGVDVTAYGSDLPGSPTFAQMIKRVLILIPNLKRLRLSSIDVAEIDNDLFDLMAYNTRIMPHFHISLQSGDNMILKRMKRRHNREQVITFCHALRKIRPNVSFGADIITGFPTETNTMFENTRQLITEAQIQFVHIFPYSARIGTPASRMPQIPIKIRRQRAAILRVEGKKELHKFFHKSIGSKVSLLIENNNTGHTENFILVKFKGKYNTGDIVKAQLTTAFTNHMEAHIE